MTNQIAAFEEAILSPDYAYAKFQSWRTSGHSNDPSDNICLVYHKNDKSPTKRIMVAVLHDGAKAVEILMKHERM